MSCHGEASLDGYFVSFSPLQVFEGVYNNARMLHFLTAVVVCHLACYQWSSQTKIFFLEKDWLASPPVTYTIIVTGNM